uniref:Glutathione synthetase n=1 Tax=Globodera rostochiensis TaxID=31243 RepID=A0A914H5U5_GLORO
MNSPILVPTRVQQQKRACLTIRTGPPQLYCAQPNKNKANKHGKKPALKNGYTSHKMPKTDADKSTITSAVATATAEEHTNYMKLKTRKRHYENGQNDHVHHRASKRAKHYDIPSLVKNVNDLQELIEDAVDWALSNGLLLRTRDHFDKTGVSQIAPFTLFPTPFPRQLFQQAVDVQKAMQMLYFRITTDLDFLKKVHEDVIKTDPVVQSFMGIIEKVHEEGIRQPITLFLQRADYMLHLKNGEGTNEKEYELKQIEVNGCAVGGIGFNTRATELHRRVLKKAGIYTSIRDVPDNRVDQMTAEALYEAWKQFGNSKAVLVFLVYKKDVLQFDRRIFEYEFERVSRDEVDVVRLSLEECSEKLKLDPVDFSLRLVDDGRAVAVVFNQVLMLGSSPTRMELDVRLMIERSTAIVLARPGMVEQFFREPNEAHMAAQIRKTFAGLWGFEADQTKNNELIQMAIKNPERFVLKPIGEGCGAHFNYFDDNIPKKLAELSATELTEFILMEKLEPKVYKNHLVRALHPTVFNTEVTAELGIYGSLIGDMTTGQILYNEQKGHGFKTKLATENEGGICSGTGMVDTPYLVDN